MLDVFATAPAPPSRLQVAEVHLRDRQWQAAADLLATIPEPDFPTLCRLRLARNLAAMESHRPDVYVVLMAAPIDDRYTIIAAKSGRPTIAARDSANGASTCLTAGPDPIAATAKALASIRKELTVGSPVALCGLGDGYLLDALATHPPELLLGRQQAVFIFEPDAGLAMTALLIHDFARPDGPIAQPRFQWFIGPQWIDAFSRTMRDGVYLPFPEANLRQGLDAASIETGLATVLKELHTIDQKLAAEVAAHYANVDAESLARLIGACSSSSPSSGTPGEGWGGGRSRGNGGPQSEDPSHKPPPCPSPGVPEEGRRTPRVLMMTTRFSTVIQYSTADAAEAYRQLGWDVRVIIEPTPHHALRKSAMRQVLAEFKPDLVFIIDHLRHEYEDIFPPNLPFVCWIQDHLPNLTHRSASQKIGTRDFVFTSAGSLFTSRHDYPRRQVVDLPNLGRVPNRPATWKSDGDDLVYVSNWSRPAQVVYDEVIAEACKSPELKAVVTSAADRIVAVYERGEWLSTHHDVRELLCEAEQHAGIAITDPELSDSVVNLLFDRLNNTYYRHQAIEWAAELAKELGLRLSLYGKGWDAHPRFAPYARGTVKPGIDLENLCRRTKINLQLEPFACFTHPRLIGGLFAGGFFLIRDHPFNHIVQRVLDFVTEHANRADTVADVRKQLAPARRQEFERLLVESACLAEQADPVQVARDWSRSSLLTAGAPPLPNLGDVTFSDRESFRERVRALLNDSSARDRLAASQRADAESRLSYQAGLARASAGIAAILRS
jgi:hypothetical protein